MAISEPINMEKEGLKNTVAIAEYVHKMIENNYKEMEEIYSLRNS